MFDCFGLSTAGSLFPSPNTRPNLSSPAGLAPQYNNAVSAADAGAPSPHPPPRSSRPAPLARTLDPACEIRARESGGSRRWRRPAAPRNILRRRAKTQQSAATPLPRPACPAGCLLGRPAAWAPQLRLAVDLSPTAVPRRSTSRKSRVERAERWHQPTVPASEPAV